MGFGQGPSPVLSLRHGPAVVQGHLHGSTEFSREGCMEGVQGPVWTGEGGSSAVVEFQVRCLEPAVQRLRLLEVARFPSLFLGDDPT